MEVEKTLPAEDETYARMVRPAEHAAVDGETNGLSVPKGGVLEREVLVEGSGPCPLPEHEVTIHYECSLPDGTLVDSSLKRFAPLTFAINRGQVIKGINEAVLNMRAGEKTRYTFHNEFAYGAAGVGVDIPPHATLVVDIELLGFGEKQRELHEMNADELILFAVDHKHEGNRCVRMQEYAKASAAYKKGLETMEQDPIKCMDDIGEVEVALRLNLTLALLHLQEYGQARDHANVVLDKDKDNTKALYRRSLAYMGLGFLDEAKEDLLIVVRRDPKDREVRATFNECKRRLVENKKQQQEIFGSMFTTSKGAPGTAPTENDADKNGIGATMKEAADTAPTENDADKNGIGATLKEAADTAPTENDADKNGKGATSKEASDTAPTENDADKNGK